MSDTDTEFLLKSYRDAVRGMLESSSKTEILNYNTEHAVIILEEMVRFSKKSFFVLCRELNGDVWTRGLLAQLEAKQKEGVDVRIMTLGRPKNTTSVQTQQIDINKRNPAEIWYNFAVADGQAYRFENDLTNRKALFCANDQHHASKLVDVFNTLSADSVTITPCEA